jgi:hypothetical protein
LKNSFTGNKKAMEIDREQILASFLSIVDNIADVEYQIRAWIGGKLPGTDFDETVCHFFDDGDPIFEDYRAYGISEKQYQLLKTFRDAFESFSDTHYHPLEFINTPDWEKIMEMAKEVLKVFNYTRQA